MCQVIQIAEYPEIWKFCTWFKKENKERGLEWVNITLAHGTFKVTPQEVKKIISFLSSGKEKEILDLIEEDLAAFNLVETTIRQRKAQTFYFDEY